MQRFKRPTCETVFYSSKKLSGYCERRSVPLVSICIRTLCLQSILDLTQVLWPTVLTYSWKSLVTSDMNTRKRYFPSLSLIKKIENKPQISMIFFLSNYVSWQCSDIYLFSSYKVKSINKNLIDTQMTLNNDWSCCDIIWAKNRVQYCFKNRPILYDQIYYSICFCSPMKENTKNVWAKSLR